MFHSFAFAVSMILFLIDASNYAMKSIFVLDTTDWLIAGIIACITIYVVTRLVQQKRICITQAVAAVLLATYLFLIFCSVVFARPNLGMHSYQLQPFWSYKEVMEKGLFELSQLIFCKGLFELVDDPFHNVLGAIVGYGIFRVVWLYFLEKQYHT